LDGSTDRGEVSNATEINTDNADFTFFIWHKSSNTATDDDRMFSKGSSSANAATGSRYSFFFFNNTLEFDIDDGSTKTTVAYGEAEHDNGLWNLFIIERDAGTSIKIRLDGSTQQNSASDSSADIDDTATPLHIGCRGGSDGNSPDFFFVAGDYSYCWMIKSLVNAATLDGLGRGANPFATGLASWICPLYGNDDPENDYTSGRNTCDMIGSTKGNDNAPVELLENYL